MRRAVDISEEEAVAERAFKMVCRATMTAVLFARRRSDARRQPCALTSSQFSETPARLA